MATPPEAQIFVFEGFQLDVARRKLTGPEGPIEVPSRAFEVLLYMVAHAGDLLEKARHSESRLAERRSSKKATSASASLRCAGRSETPRASLASSPPSRDAAISSWRRCASRLRQMATPASARPGSRWPLYAGAGLALAVALLVAFRFWPASTPASLRRSRHVSAAPLAPASIAVLPFADLSRRQGHGVFRRRNHRRTHETVCRRSADCDVIGRRSSFAFKGKGDDAQSIGEKLHVATILEGSVRKEGDRIRHYGAAHPDAGTA